MYLQICRYLKWNSLLDIEYDIEHESYDAIEF